MNMAKTESKVDFSNVSKAVLDRFKYLSKHELFLVDVSKDAIWEAYLESFPEGTNPLFRERTEHDCSCCRNFVNNLGRVVAIINGKIESVWKIDVGFPYNEVAAKLDSLVTSAKIVSVFRTKERQFGAEYTIEQRDNIAHRWNHFVGKISQTHQHNSPGEEIGRHDTTVSVSVFRRGLEEFTADSLDTVIELIKNNLLYRGQEFLSSVQNFKLLFDKYHQLSDATQKDLFIWSHFQNRDSRFRSTVIGTLVEDLSAGKDSAVAVGMFESKVAPQNYKRPSALITPRMIEAAMATIGELDLEDALQRRHARLSDISVNNVLFVDNSVQAQMKDGIEGLLMQEAKPTKVNIDKPREVTISDFMSTIVPQTKSIELLLENSMMNNFMSITAPAIVGSRNLFKWNNDFAWSYDGNVADSIKQRVKRAGGNVSTKYRVSLGWFNTDDLDIHVIEPNGNHISFHNKCSKLDVDMNVNDPVRDAVENVCWDRMMDGEYRVFIHNYRKRESIDTGFVLEVEIEGNVHTYSYEKPIPDQKEIQSLVLKVKKGKVVEVVPNSALTIGTSGQDKWGLQTEQLVKVNTIMLSPNHWDDNEVGNKHWFFILEGCKNPEPTRGIYNEFLSSRLEEHRKVFEILGDKTKCPVDDNQLSGVGFSSTRKDCVKVVAKGSNRQEAIAITF